jgi:tetratricopeptide (TPR) repeat protein
MFTRLALWAATSVIALTIDATVAADDGGASPRALYQEGARLYNLGQYEEAVRAFEAAYAISGAKPLLFNIAQAHRLAGPSHCERALRAYESYLREDAAASNRDEIEERISEMRRCVDRAREADAAAQRPSEPKPPPVDTTPAPAARPAGPNKGPLVLAVGGGALFAVGAGLYTAARIKFEHEQAHCPCPEGSFASWQSITTTSYVLVAAGGVAATAGLSWWFLARPRGTSYALTAGPSGMYVTGSF